MGCCSVAQQLAQSQNERQPATISATSCGSRLALIGQLLFVCFSLCNESVICSVVFTLFYPSTSPNASFAFISFFLQSLTKAPHDNTPAIKITSPVSLEATFVVRSVAAAFGHGYHTHTHNNTWHGCGQIFVAAASCATKVYVCHQGYTYMKAISNSMHRTTSGRLTTWTWRLTTRHSHINISSCGLHLHLSTELGKI